MPHSIGEMTRSFPTWLNLRDAKNDGDGESESDMWDEEMESDYYDSGEERTAQKQPRIRTVSGRCVTLAGKISE